MSLPEALSLLVVVALGALVVLYTFLLGSGPVPSNRAQIAGVLAMLESVEGEPIYELGAGFGRVAFAVADRFPQRRVVALERSPVPYLFCRLRLRLFPRANLTFRRDDFLRVPLGEAKVLLAYVHTGAMARLGGKLKAECPGAALVSHTFAVRGWEPVARAKVDDLYRSPVYLFRI